MNSVVIWNYRLQRHSSMLLLMKDRESYRPTAIFIYLFASDHIHVHSAVIARKFFNRTVSKYILT